MDSLSESDAPTLRFGRLLEANGKCSVLVASPLNLLRSNFVRDLLTININDYKQSFQINFCESILKFLDLATNDHYDFIVMLVDPVTDIWLDEVEKNIAFLDTKFLCGRICLAIDTSYVPPADIIDSIQELEKKYSLLTFCGDLANENGSILMSKRIMRFIDQTCRNIYGLPLIAQLPKF